MSATLIHTAIRAQPDDLEEIDRRARQLGLTRTRFLVDAALERLPEHQTSLEERLTAIEQHINRLNAAVLGG